MKKDAKAAWLSTLFFPLFGIVIAQKGSPVPAIDFVQVLDGRRVEALFFIEQNWRQYRQVALEKGLIQSYHVIEIPRESIIPVDFILVAEYASRQKYDNREAGFRTIMKQIRPDGPRLLNDLVPDAFRKILFFKLGDVLYSDK